MINTVRKCVQDTEIHFNWGEEKVFWGRHPTDGYEQEQLGQRLEYERGCEELKQPTEVCCRLTAGGAEWEQMRPVSCLQAFLKSLNHLV